MVLVRVHLSTFPPPQLLREPWHPDNSRLGFSEGKVREKRKFFEKTLICSTDYKLLCKEYTLKNAHLHQIVKTPFTGSCIWLMSKMPSLEQTMCVEIAHPVLCLVRGRERLS